VLAKSRKTKQQTNKERNLNCNKDHHKTNSKYVSIITSKQQAKIKHLRQKESVK